MVVCNRPVPARKLQSYVKTIKLMEQSRCNSYLYFKLDQLREQLHTEILSHAGTTREDKFFNYEFAKLVEDLI